MCNCSRMALRCGDVDASSRGGDGGASATLARAPDLLGRPLARPLGRDVLVVGVRLRLRRRKELDETIDLEIVRTEQIDPFAVTELELDPVVTRPLDLVQPGLWPHELLPHTF